MSTQTVSEEPPRIRKIFEGVIRYPTATDFHPDPHWAERDNAISNEDGARPDPAPRQVSFKEAVFDLGHRIASAPAIGADGSDLD